jgi:hypothetical protein
LHLDLDLLGIETVFSYEIFHDHFLRREYAYERAYEISMKKNAYERAYEISMEKNAYERAYEISMEKKRLRGGV